MTYHNTIVFSPYHLVLNKEHISLIEFEVKTLRTAQEVDMELFESQKYRLQQLN